MRFPVAAKIALQIAGAIGGTPGSPTPAGTRVPTPTDYEHLVIRHRWSDKLYPDPYYNVNFMPFRDDWVERPLR